MELFHPYKKLLEDTWRKPEFFYSFFAPLSHSFHPNGAVYKKPKLKQIESFVTALRLIWPEFRDHFWVILDYVNGLQKKHLRNVLLIMEFFVPIVRFSLLSFEFYGLSPFVDFNRQHVFCSIYILQNCLIYFLNLTFVCLGTRLLYCFEAWRFWLCFIEASSSFSCFCSTRF